MANHYFPLQPHAAYDKAELTIAMGRLIEVHEIHIDLVPGNITV